MSKQFNRDIKQLYRICSTNPLKGLLTIGRLSQQVMDDQEKKEQLLASTRLFSAMQVNALFRVLTKLNDDKIQLFDNITQQQIKAFTHHLLENEHLFTRLTDAQISQLARNPTLNRIAYIAIIRKFLKSQQRSDPFTKGRFSYSLLAQGGTEQNYLYVSRYIQQCSHLPIQTLVSLMHSTKDAKRLLMDVINTPHYFKLSVAILERFPGLAKSIAKDWQFLLETIPLSTKTMHYLQTVLPALKQKYHHFSAVSLHTRVNRNRIFAPVIIKTVTSHQSVIPKRAIGAGLLLAPSTYFHAQSIWALSGALVSGAPLVPAFMSTLLTALPFAAPVVIYNLMKPKPVR